LERWSGRSLLRWIELCRVWRKAQLQSKLLYALFFHCVIIVYCFASIVTQKGQQHGNILLLPCFFFGL
jgi:hypothetical protein